MAKKINAKMVMIVVNRSNLNPLSIMPGTTSTPPLDIDDLPVTHPKCPS